MNIGKTLLFLNPLSDREPEAEGYRPRFGNRLANARALRPRHRASPPRRATAPANERPGDAPRRYAPSRARSAISKPVQGEERESRRRPRFRVSRSVRGEEPVARPQAEDRRLEPRPHQAPSDRRRHRYAYNSAISASPNAEHLISVAPSICRAKS